MLPYFEAAQFLLGDFFSPVFASELVGGRVFETEKKRQELRLH